MNKVRVLLIGAALLAAMQGCQSRSTPTAPDLVAISHARLQSFLDSVQSKTALLRGLMFLRPLHLKLLTNSQYADRLSQNKSWTDYFAHYDDFYGVAIRQTGFLSHADNGLNLSSTVQDYYTGFPAAFYQPGTDSIFIISRGDDPADIDTLLSRVNFGPLLSHELTHALQDQNLDAFVGDSSQTATSDFQLAQTCLAEGDANFVYYLYSGKYLNVSSTWERDAVISATNEKEYFYLSYFQYPHQFPDYLDIPGIAPYEIGPYYVGIYYKTGSDWSSVNAIYSSRPSSTIDVMSLSPPQVTEFSFNDIIPYFDTLQMYWSDDVLGPINIDVLLKTYDRPASGRSPHLSNGYGWDGDHLFFAKYPTSSQGEFVWAFAFQSGPDADAGFALLSDIVANTGDSLARPTFTTSGPDTIAADCWYMTYASNAYSSALIRKGNTIWWVENMQASQDQVIHAISQKTLAKRIARRTDHHAKNPFFPVIRGLYKYRTTP